MSLAAAYIKLTYDSYFDRLEKIAEHLTNLKRVVDTLDKDNDQFVIALMKREIKSMEDEIIDFAKNLSETGIAVIKKCG